MECKNDRIDDDVLDVSIPSGRVIRIAQIYGRGMELGFDDRVLLADLYVIDMKDSDVILGMNWLRAYHAVIKCHEKEDEILAKYLDLPFEDKSFCSGGRCSARNFIRMNYKFLGNFS